MTQSIRDSWFVELRDKRNFIEGDRNQEGDFIAFGSMSQACLIVSSFVSNVSAFRAVVSWFCIETCGTPETKSCFEKLWQI